MRVCAALILGTSLVLSVMAGRGSTDYRIEIINQMGHQMDFFYTDQDTVEHPLGAVNAFDSQVFTIVSPHRKEITIVERGAAMPGYVDRRAVALKADTLVEVPM